MSRIKNVAEVIAGQSPSSSEVDLLDRGLPFLQGNAEFGMRHPVPRYECATADKVSMPGDVLLSVRAPVGAVNLADRAFGIGRGLCAVRPHFADSGFLAWWLQHQKPELDAQSTGSTFAAVSASIVAALPFPDFELPRQRAITDYLDRETARIDTLIEEQQRLIDLLRERRGSVEDSLLASRTDSRHTTIKRVLRPLARPPVPGLGVVTAFRDGVVTLRSNRREDGYTFSSTEHGYQEIRPGDLVFHALDGFAGAVGVSDSHGNATPVYHVCAAQSDDHLPYVARMLRYLGRSGFLSTQAPNVRERSVDFRNWAMFGRLPISLPPLDEQRRIAAYLDEQTAKIDQLIAETERFIELARERRAALITAAVTGQIDVREEVA